MKKLPLGIQSIREILEEGYSYVDKTHFAKKLIDEGKHYFLSRPRRFGKSLFVNTLEHIFRGNKELFKGYQIAESDYDWQEYPVLHFDFSAIESRVTAEFKGSLKRKLLSMGTSLGVSVEVPTLQEGLESLIAALSQKNRVVVLVDEYDKPIINNLDHLDVAQQNRKLMRDFFGTLKSLDEHLKFTFFTGVSKFSQVSIFSGLNNLTDITMNPKYSALMGYTEEEMKRDFKEHLQAIAKEKGREESSLLSEIREWYNGYRFSEEKMSVYNPYSTLRFLSEHKPQGYWYSTGTPSFLIDQVKKYPESMVSLDGASATEEELMDISDLEAIDLAALMYQTGYLTIQGYNPISRRYRLGLPNEEVRSAFINSLVGSFAKITNLRSSEKLVKALEEYRPDVLFEQIENGLSSFAYQVFVDAKERTYQAMLLSMLYGMGFDPLSERATNTGRIDVTLELPSVTYLLELKLDKSCEEALEQIHNKRYFTPYLHKQKKIVILGANFSSKNRNISGWKGALLSESGEVIQEILS